MCLGDSDDYFTGLVFMNMSNTNDPNLPSQVHYKIRHSPALVDCRHSPVHPLPYGESAPPLASIFKLQRSCLTATVLCSPATHHSST